jgi:hypothetical protein
VFRGLTGSKLVRPARTTGTLSEAAIGEARRLPDNQVEAFRKLKDGTINERVAAANSLRFAVTDYPLTPVCLCFIVAILGSFSKAGN